MDDSCGIQNAKKTSESMLQIQPYNFEYILKLGIFDIYRNFYHVDVFVFVLYLFILK